jgi:hypothetical protein
LRRRTPPASGHPVERRVQRDRERRLAADQVPPGQFDADASAFRHQLEAFGRNRERVVLLTDRQLAFERLVQHHGHFDPSGVAVAVDGCNPSAQASGADTRLAQ